MGLPNEHTLPHDTLRELGVGPFDVNHVMAEYYVLERLVADGSRKAKWALDRHEQAYAPQLLNYLSMICGGELRHAPRILGREFDDYCDCYSRGICYNCGDYEEPGHQPSDEYCKDCGYGEYWHRADKTWMVCKTLTPGGVACSDFEPSSGCECGYGDGDSDWMQDIPAPLMDWFSESEIAGRNSAWISWMQFYKRNGPTALTWAYDLFDREWDGGGYGGKAWASIARVARDYAHGKMSRRIFMDRCWTLQHNGGNVFDKLWGSTDRSNLQQALEMQAQDNYGFLNRWTSQPTRSLWAQRDFHRFDLFDRDPIWLGRELPDRMEW